MALRGSPATNTRNPNFSQFAQGMNPSFSQHREPPNQIINEIRTVISGRGIFGIRDFVLLFNKYSKNGELGRHETEWCLKENG